VSEWRDSNFGEYVNVINGYAFKSSNFLDTGTAETLPIIKIKNVANGNVHLNGAQHHIFDKSLSKYLVENKDVLIALTGNHPQAESQVVGIASRYKLNEKALLNQRVAKIVTKDENLLAQDFIYYFLIDKNTHQYLASQSSGSANQANISKADIEQIPISIPCPKEQKAIASVLSSLDDKIDLLHRQNTTLEAMAETLFRQWFVEEAQEGWEECTLDDLITVKGGTTPSTKEPSFWNGSISWTSPRDLSNQQSVFMFNTERKITEKGLDQIGSGLLPVGTVLMSSRAPIGYLAISDIPVAINQGYIAIVCDKLVSNYFMYLWCKVNMEQIKNSGNGSTFEEISKSNFKALVTIKPSENALSRFNTSAEAIFAKIKTNQRQIQTLEKLRDNLLPKLMSGDIRIEA
jgi:type I restriction enzyme S subunit